ncbi:hypothetical protein SmJEL517_g02833 [Synchytrium microbalum]|uniref:Dynein assembly factor 1, axonemal homolog n=1 Tax=Synchytrium microbalum TaxID=1806994 RepID=A0A507C614_9FUNG|nr:uncharacterized protein SmJEL517_g02833 [Synchytrium microbalum]TPX34549.1 hypothetical protein SmJEL517_g02833 [Synchytrium microbalum]
MLYGYTPPVRRFGRNLKTLDDKGNTIMTKEYLKQLCKEQKLYQTPELNDKIYLHFKGFTKIEHLEAYTGLRSLWLEGNGIGKIENIDTLVELRCLYLQQNCIEEIENLDKLVQLDTINLSNNLVKHISGLDNLPALRTLQLSHNFIRTADDLRHLANCHFISILDLSNNKIEDPDIVEVFEVMENLAVLNLMANPVTSKIQNYRKTLISRCKGLTYLDDRPVFDKERLATEAWARGGIEAEREERQRQRDEDRDQNMRNFEALRRLQEEARARRRENGALVEPIFSPELSRFRDEMLSKVDEPQHDDDNNEEEEMPQPDMAPAAETWDRPPPMLTANTGATLQEIDDGAEEEKDDDQVPLLETVTAQSEVDETSPSVEDKGKAAAVDEDTSDDEVHNDNAMKISAIDDIGDYNNEGDDEGFIPSPLTDPILSQGYQLLPAQKEADRDVIHEIVKQSAHTLAEEESDLSSPLIKTSRDSSVLVDMKKDVNDNYVTDEMDAFASSRSRSNTDEEDDEQVDEIPLKAVASTSSMSKPYVPPVSAIPATRVWERVLYDNDDDFRRREDDESSVDEEAEVYPARDSATTLIGDEPVVFASGSNSKISAVGEDLTAHKVIQMVEGEGGINKDSKIRKVAIVEVDSSDDEE